MTRDSIIWHLTLGAAVLSFLVASTTTLIPPAYVPHVKDLAALCGFLAGWLGNSPLKGQPKG